MQIKLSDLNMQLGNNHVKLGFGFHWGGVDGVNFDLNFQLKH